MFLLPQLLWLCHEHVNWGAAAFHPAHKYICHLFLLILIKQHNYILTMYSILNSLGVFFFNVVKAFCVYSSLMLVNNLHTKYKLYFHVGFSLLA